MTLETHIGLLVVESGSAVGAVPLTGVRVDAVIRGWASRVVLRQRYRNDEQVPVEAVYVFPLPEGAAICGLVIETAGRRIAGRVQEREAAFDAYDDALAAGHGAVLLDQERPNVFTASVGNLLPGQEISVELTWVEELPRDGDALRFVVPMTVAPRYAPAEDRAGVSPTPAERVSPPIVAGTPYRLELAADVELPGGIARVESPSHALRVDLASGRAHVELAAEKAAMDRDLVVLLTPVAPAEPWGLVETQEEYGAVATVSFVPRLPGGREPREVVFLIDRSGSMQGSSIAAVRRALELALRGLVPGDRFDIVGFGSGYEALFGAPRAYDDASLAHASAHVGALEADLGGTEILPALAAVLERPIAGGLPREVVLLTDGEVSNDEAVIALARGHAATTRIFTFGIGYGASEHLVRAVARVSGGEAEMIHPDERIEPKVLRQIGRLGRPGIDHVALDWGQAPERQAPAALSRLADGEPLTVHAWLRGPAPASVRLRARSAGEVLSWEVPLVATAGADRLLGTLAARAAIQEIEEGGGARPGSAQRGRSEKRDRSALLDLALRYGLTSSVTSLVAIEERDAEGVQAPELRRVSVALTHGWGDVESSAASGVLFQRNRDLPLHRPPMVCAPGPVFSNVLRSAPDARLAAQPHDYRSFEDDLACANEPGLGLPAADPLHLALARLQRADGSWELGAELAGLLAVSAAVLLAAWMRLGGDPALRSVLATAAALAALRTHCASAVSEWRPLAAKAEAWLTAALPQARIARTALEHALDEIGLSST